MHRVMLIRIGGRKLHLLKMVGALVLAGAALGVISTVAELFRIIKQFQLAQTNSALSMQVFGLLPEALTSDVVVGFFMQPSAWFMLWLALFIIGVMIYRSGSLVVPIEEDVEKD